MFISITYKKYHQTMSAHLILSNIRQIDLTKSINTTIL